MSPEVIQVIPTDDYKVYVYMDDNTVRLYDATPLIAKGGIFSRIKDPNTFKNTCTILNDTLAWDLSGCMDGINCIDICPDTLRECPEVLNIEQVKPDAIDLQMLHDIENDPECHEFISADEAMKELGL